MDDEYQARAAGSRVGVLFVGLVVGALVMTAVWVGIAGNPLSDINEVVYSEVVVADVNAERDTMCWSEDPGRRDAAQLCAILALDPEIEVPQVGDHVLLGLVMLRPPGDEPVRQAVYIAPLSPAVDGREPTPVPTSS